MSSEQLSSHVAEDIEQAFLEMDFVKLTLRTGDDTLFAPELLRSSSISHWLEEMILLPRDWNLTFPA